MNQSTQKKHVYLLSINSLQFTLKKLNTNRADFIAPFSLVSLTLYIALWRLFQIFLLLPYLPNRLSMIKLSLWQRISTHTVPVLGDQQSYCNQSWRISNHTLPVVQKSVDTAPVAEDQKSYCPSGGVSGVMLHLATHSHANLTQTLNSDPFTGTNPAM